MIFIKIESQEMLSETIVSEFPVYVLSSLISDTVKVSNTLTGSLVNPPKCGKVIVKVFGVAN